MRDTRTIRHDRAKHPTGAPVTFVTRAKSNFAYQVEATLRQSALIHVAIVWTGEGPSRQRVRLIEVMVNGKWERYLTNELDRQCKISPPSRFRELSLISV